MTGLWLAILTSFYNVAVQTRFTLSLLARMAVPLVLLPLLGIAAYVRLSPRTRSHAALAGGVIRASPALATAVSAAQSEPWRADLWEAAALAAQESGEAIQLAQVAVSLGGLSGEGWLGLGDALLAQGETDAALSAWRRAMDHAVSPEEVYRRESELFLRMGDYPAAISALQSLSRIHPADSRLHYQLGLLLAVLEPGSALGHLSQAGGAGPEMAARARSLERLIRQSRLLSDEPAFTSLVVGQELASWEEWELALEAFLQATRLRPDYADAWAFVGEARQQLGQEGYPDLKRAYVLDPTSLAVNSLHALYWRRQDQPEFALTYLRAASSYHADNPALQVDLGNTQAAIGDVTAALRYFQRAVELAPDQPQFWQHLARFSIEYEVQVDEIGLPAARQALLLDREDSASLTLVGQAFILLEDPLLAERFLALALENDPDYADAHLHLGRLALSQGDMERGRQHLETVQRLAPGTPLSARAAVILQYYFP